MSLPAIAVAAVLLVFGGIAHEAYGYFVSSITTGNIEETNPTYDFYDGEKKAVHFGENIFAFYYDFSNIAYKASPDNGTTWGPAQSTNSGIISTNDGNFMWTTLHAEDAGGTEHIVLLYYTTSGNSSTFYAKHGTVSGTSISWDPAAPLFSVPAAKICGSEACGAAVGSADSSGNLFDAMRWYSAYSGTYHYEIWESKDDGRTWQGIVGDTDTRDGYRNSMSLAPLADGKMLFVDALYDRPELSYSVFNGGSWSTTFETSGAGLGSGPKQISAASNSTGFAFVAFGAGGPPGTLRMGTWNNDTGLFQSFETADSTLKHALPAITVTPGIIRIYSVANGIVYETDKVNGAWDSPQATFGARFSTPDQLTSLDSVTGALWTEGPYTNYTLKYGDTPSKSSYSLTVTSQDSYKNALLGFYTELYAQNGTQLDAGYTPYNFTLDDGKSYTVHVEDYGKYRFSHWADTGSTNATRSVSLISDSAITAVYMTSPNPPYNLTASLSSSTQINLSWNAPTIDGGSPVTGYKINRSSDGGSTWTTVVKNTGSTATSYTDSGLTPDTKYMYHVFAINSIGTSARSNTASATTPLLGLTLNGISNSTAI